MVEVSREIERLRTRRRRLEQLRSWHDHVCARRRMVHTDGLRPREIVVRADFVLTDTTTRPPIARLIRPRGVALQAYLTMLFEAQCRHRHGTTPFNDRALRATERGEIGWLDLVASTADADPTNSVEHATVQDNLVRQIKAALRTLTTEHLVSLTADSGRNGRYEHFTIGHEAGGEEYSAYTVPRGAPSGMIRLPIDFFLKGWVHVLSPAEIATYTMLCHLAQRYPDQHAENGVFVAGSTRKRRYGLRRDVYEAHQQLTEFKLIERMPDPKRWPNGRIRNYQEVTQRGETMSSHRFRLLKDGFRNDALHWIAERLDRILPVDRQPAEN